MYNDRSEGNPPLPGIKRTTHNRFSTEYSSRFLPTLEMAGVSEDGVTPGPIQNDPYPLIFIISKQSKSSCLYSRAGASFVDCLYMISWGTMIRLAGSSLLVTFSIKHLAAWAPNS